jgi:hypothetical protein
MGEGKMVIKVTQRQGHFGVKGGMSKILHKICYYSDLPDDIKDFALLMHAVFSITCSDAADFMIWRAQANHCEYFGNGLKLLIILNRAAVVSTETMASGDTYVSAIAKDSHLEGYYIEF